MLQETSGCRIAVCFFFIATLGITAGCGQIRVDAYANLDPAQESFLEIALTPPLVIPLHGGVRRELIADTRRLLSPGGILTFVEGEEIRIAGESVLLLGSIETGTTCVAEDSDDQNAGTASVSVYRGSALDLHGTGLASSALIEIIAGGELPITFDVDDVPLEIDFRRLLSWRIDGSVRTHLVAESLIPDDVSVIGGAPFTLHLHLISATRPPEAPILAECPEFAGR